MEVHSQHFLKALPNQPPHSWSLLLSYFDGLTTKRKKKNKKKKKKKNEKRKKKWCCGLILLSVCVMCVVWTGYYPAWEQEEEQPRSPTQHPHTAPHSLDSF